VRVRERCARVPSISLREGSARKPVRKVFLMMKAWYGSSVVSYARRPKALDDSVLSC
jgi:hypothetical protein